jgi:predicted dehydrogenase
MTLGRHELLAYDPNPDARGHAEKLLKVKTCPTLDEIWNFAPACVLICAPPSEHMWLALVAARHNAHLFLEKPLADRTEKLEELERLVRERELITLVGCNMRFHPGPARVKELLEKGAVGAVFSARIQAGSFLPDWRPSTDYHKSYTASRAQGGGAILDCIHELDLSLWYFGPATVAAALALPAGKLGIEVEGLAEILLQHSSGVLSSVNLNFIQRDYRRGCQIIGEHGTIYWDFEQPAVEIRNGAGLDKKFPIDPAWQVNQMYVDELQHFLTAVERRERTLCPLEQGSAALRIALRAREMALETGAAQGA